jgi:predicted HicB family RNase H-like nuclease
MKEYVWKIVEDDGVFIVRKPNKAPIEYEHHADANRGVMRSYRATLAKWKRHGWTVENECISDNCITVYAEEPKRATKQFIVHLDADQHARAMEKSALTGVTLSKMIRDALEIVLAE